MERFLRAGFAPGRCMPVPAAFSFFRQLGVYAVCVFSSVIKRFNKCRVFFIGNAR